jgi:RNA polymerase sigma factor (sigma-70 family)
LKNNDATLWEAFKGGDSIAFTEIYNFYIKDLLSYGYRITTDSQLVRDSIHDLFLHVWQTRANLSPTSSIRFYLYRSLRNRIVRNLEKNENVVIDSASLFENIIGALSTEDNLIASEQQNEQISKLSAAIQQLPKRQQEIIQLRYYHDFSLDEISQMMSISNQSVRNLLHRAITELRYHFKFTG